MLTEIFWLHLIDPTIPCEMALPLRKNIIGLCKKEILQDLQVYLAEPIPSFRADQIYHLLYKVPGIDNWNGAETLPKKYREALEKIYHISYGVVHNESISMDGTRKLLLKLEDTTVETVLIPEASRLTLCVSSQAGCSLACKFCHTGTQGFQKNLSAASIVSQFMNLRQPLHSAITNVVFMGQGEPLYNWKQVKTAINILTDPSGIGLGHSRITLSTSGIVPLIASVATELGVRLAVSLHAPNDELRRSLMPIAKTWPLELLLDACKQFSANSSLKTRRITFEYVMLHDVNDDPYIHAPQLATLLQHLPASINLIPFNPWPGSPYQSSPVVRIAKFRLELVKRGIVCTVRENRGSDIMAACGQLKGWLDGTYSVVSSGPKIQNEKCA